ncbi:MAG TPA: hypothetical protein VLV87_07750 [Gammaproteobacteria bacterium]|nr:hypothetical protein [Gammaproteobacteria bacterium]
MRAFPFVVATLCGFLLSACASVPAREKPFTLIKPSEGWVRMQSPPAESAAIIESAGQSTKDMLADKKKYRVTWFSRKTDDYLIYFQVRDPRATCGDEAPEFYKEADGRWAEDRLSRISLCKQ